jgi:hypothetical protein
MHLALLSVVLLAAAGQSGLYVSAAIIGGGVGGFIGYYKNRTVLGAVLGFFLGCLGWLIIAVIPKKRRY